MESLENIIVGDVLCCSGTDPNVHIVCVVVDIDKNADNIYIRVLNNPEGLNNHFCIHSNNRFFKKL